MSDQWIAHYSAHLDAGLMLASQGSHEAAIQKYDAAIEVNPSISVGYINRGLAWLGLKRYSDALVDLNHAAELQPNLAVIYSNRSVIFREMGQRDASAQDCLKAIELAGEAAIDGHAYGNMATYYFELGQYNLAITYYEKAIALQPDNAVNRWNYGMCLMLQGDLIRGWREYHWRWQDPRYVAEHRNFNVPIWLGQESLRGKTILLQAEQGFGDMIQFCRYATLVAAQGAHVLLEVQAGLVELCKSLAGVSEIFSKTDVLPDFDFYCPMMSLPLAFSTTIATIPAPAKYLASDPLKVQKWQAILGVKTKPRIGIVWSCDEGHQTSACRSIPLETFVHAVSAEFEFVSLQRMIWRRDIKAVDASPIRRFEADLIDFSETAALCECMDLVVSVDTSVAHLAGALGKPVCILIHANNDWRWLLDRSDSVWYPTAKLYRQEKMFEWDAQLVELKADIEKRFLNAS